MCDRKEGKGFLDKVDKDDVVLLGYLALLVILHTVGMICATVVKVYGSN